MHPSTPPVTARKAGASGLAPKVKADPIKILEITSLECRTSEHDKVYHALVIATPSGYQCVTYWGARTAKLNEHPETQANVSFQSAKAAYEKKVSLKLREYAVVAATIPDVPRFAGGAQILLGADRDAFLSSHVTKTTIDPTSAVREQRRRAAHDKECHLAIGIIQDLLSTENSYSIDEIQTQQPENNPLGSITLKKNGGTITVDGTTDPTAIAICRKAALEIGGTFTLTGKVDKGRFLVDRDPGGLLVKARPHIVALQNGMTNGVADTLAKLVSDDTWDNLIVRNKLNRQIVAIPRAIFREIQHEFGFA